MNQKFPYEKPEILPPALQEVLSYWEKLRRGQETIPFSDDIKLSQYPKLEGELILLDVFAKPQRHRFSIVGKSVVKAYGKDVAGIFLDELEPGPPFTLIHSQASAAVEARMPNFYVGESYLRLLLPAWGDGHVSALLGIIGPKMPSM
ncbi:MAG: hypothetical protein ACI89J_002872 [Hyphomicrobiaceae bacterium]|jgi:hypothetical protein